MTSSLEPHGPVRLLSCGRWDKTASRAPLIYDFSGMVIGDVQSVSEAEWWVP
jgi:hypothetical protein